MALEFKLRDNGGESACCDSCDSAAPLAEFDWGPPYTAKHDKPHRLLCEFCCTTMTSRYTEYPHHDAYGQMRAEVWRANAALFNALKFGLDPSGVPGTRPSKEWYAEKIADTQQAEDAAGGVLAAGALGVPGIASAAEVAAAENAVRNAPLLPPQDLSSDPPFDGVSVSSEDQGETNANDCGSGDDTGRRVALVARAMESDSGLGQVLGWNPADLVRLDGTTPEVASADGVDVPRGGEQP